MIRDVTSWSNLSSIDILFQLFVQSTMTHKRMFRVNFNMLFIDGSLELNLEDVDEPNYLLPPDLKI